MQSETWRRLLLLAALVAGIAAAWYWRDHLSAESVATFIGELGWVAPLVFIGGYIIATVFFMPGLLFTLAGGALFGPIYGTLYSLTGATIGATLAFLICRFLFRDWIQNRFGTRLKTLNEGMAREGGFYLYSIRMIPLFPFFVVNLVPAFLGVPLRTYVLGTFIGIIPGSIVFTTVGAGLGSIFDRGEEFTAAGILTPEIIAALVGLAVLALIPVVYKKIKARRG